MKSVKEEPKQETQPKAGEDRVLLRGQEVSKYFSPGRKTLLKRSHDYLRAVDRISFTIEQGETFGLVGESGCGKTTTAKLILLLEEVTSGAIYYQGENIRMLKGAALRRYRGAVQAVFQDPWSSLNPRLRVGFLIGEPLKVNKKISRKELKQRVEHLLISVGLRPRHANLFPHELSGGQRQRVTIARALSLDPGMIVLDEPVSSLDISVQAQVMNLLKDLQEEHGMSYLLIAHDLGTVQYLSDRVAVMYLGQIVEEASSEELFANPLHVYTKALISAALPVRLNEQREEMVLTGEVPSPMNPPAGCHFHPRCPFATKRCALEPPIFSELAPGHWASCHLYI